MRPAVAIPSHARQLESRAILGRELVRHPRCQTGPRRSAPRSAWLLRFRRAPLGPHLPQRTRAEYGEVAVALANVSGNAREVIPPWYSALHDAEVGDARCLSQQRVCLDAEAAGSGRSSRAALHPPRCGGRPGGGGAPLWRAPRLLPREVDAPLDCSCCHP